MLYPFSAVEVSTALEVNHELNLHLMARLVRRENIYGRLGVGKDGGVGPIQAILEFQVNPVNRMARTT